MQDARLGLHYAGLTGPLLAAVIRWCPTRLVLVIGSKPSSFTQGNGTPYGIDAALVRAVCRAGMPGHVIAREKQLWIGFVFGGFKFLKQ